MGKLRRLACATTAGLILFTTSLSVFADEQTTYLNDIIPYEESLDGEIEGDGIPEGENGDLGEEVPKEEEYLSTGTWVDYEEKVRVVGETTNGQGSPMCKNVRYSVKTPVKGIQFQVRLPQKPAFESRWDNHCIYIGYEGLEIGLSTTQYKDNDRGYTWFYNYAPSTPGIYSNNKSGRGETYYDYGSTVTLQLYLGIDKRLHLNIIQDGMLDKDVWVSPVKHQWSEYTYQTPKSRKTPGTRIINSLEQNNKQKPWSISHQKVTIENIQLLVDTGWKVPTTSDVRFGLYDLKDRYGKVYSGIEYTIPNSNIFFESKEQLGKLPMISYGDKLTDRFSVVTPE